MRRTLFHLATALVTFGLGVSLVTLWLAFRTPAALNHSPLPARRQACTWTPPAPPALSAVPAAPAAPAAPAPEAQPYESASDNPRGWTLSGDSVRTVSGGVLNGKAISKPAPAYPAIARAARASGMVVVQITVDECGEVIGAQAVSGHPLLRQASVQAAYQSRFTPTRLSGQPVKVIGTITYNFVLQ